MLSRSSAFRAGTSNRAFITGYSLGPYSAAPALTSHADVRAVIEAKNQDILRQSRESRNQKPRRKRIRVPSSASLPSTKAAFRAAQQQQQQQRPLHLQPLSLRPLSAAPTTRGAAPFLGRPTTVFAPPERVNFFPAVESIAVGYDINPGRLSATELLTAVLAKQESHPVLNPGRDRQQYALFCAEAAADAAERIQEAAAAVKTKNKSKAVPAEQAQQGSALQRCWKCRRPGHTGDKCFATTTLDAEMCHACGLAGHYARGCPFSSPSDKKSSLLRGAKDGGDGDSDSAAAEAQREMLKPSRKRNIWNNSGVYVLVSKTGERYVGTSEDIRRRVQQHRVGGGMGAKFTAQLAGLRRVVPLPLWRVQAGGDTVAAAAANSASPGTLVCDKPTLLARGSESSASTTTSSALASSAPRLESASGKVHVLVPATTNPLLEPSLYCEETRQYLAQLRAAGAGRVDRVKGAAFCKLQLSTYDRFKLALMLHREARWLLGASSSGAASESGKQADDEKATQQKAL